VTKLATLYLKQLWFFFPHKAVKRLRQVPVTDGVRICRIFGQSATSVLSLWKALGLWAGTAKSVQWLGCWLDGRWLVVRFIQKAGDTMSPQNTQTRSGAHPVSYSVRTGGSCHNDKVTRAWNWPLHLIPRSWTSGAIPPSPIRFH